MSKIVGYGSYESVGQLERQYGQFSSFGAYEPYDLRVPGRVAEIKKVLKALGNYWSDKASNPADPQQEDTFKYIDASTPMLDAWDGPTADAYALTVGRHLGRFPALMPPGQREPLMQIQPQPIDQQGHSSIIGGPQPTVAGLELIAQAAHELLKDSVQLEQYIAWRGGVLDCVGLTSGRCIPPDAVVLQTNKTGRAWDPRGYTFAWTDSPTAKTQPQLLAALNQLDQALINAWTMAPKATNETDRKTVADTLVTLRNQRDQVVRQLNQGAPEPTCLQGYHWDKTQGYCVPRCPSGFTWDDATMACVAGQVDVGYMSYQDCMTQQQMPEDAGGGGATEDEAKDVCGKLFPKSSTASTVAAFGVLAAIGVGAALLFRDRKVPEFSAPR